MIHPHHKHDHNYLLNDEQIHRNEKRTLFVVFLTTTMMLVEIVYGYLTSSMALLADGWHMASHAGALTISLAAYKLAKSERLNRKFSFGAGKFIPLGGYTSAIVLGLIALLMAYYSIERLVHPVPIRFDEAIAVAVVGLFVNVICVVALFDKHHHHHHHDDEPIHDHNMKSAYIHVLADAMTSVFAIFALSFGKWFHMGWLDSVMGIVGSVVILRWAYHLCRETVWELLDGHAKAIDHEKIRKALETEGVEVSDLHVWRIAPHAHACEVVVVSIDKKGTDYYRRLLVEQFNFSHLIIEER